MTSDYCVVVFDVWGQRCSTKVDTLPVAIDWLRTCYEYGFLVPVRIDHWHGYHELTSYDSGKILEMLNL